ncbi:PCMT-domain-containing protein [Neurospora crassa]|uniref:protein-L-isoaspartate(D-aspartate) O-methyltransferase n=1 Tax=Neurospora crassa (strain ATCC 24698 / 74-OR23-1A / CBS 708.71 / DSM 1257 / FGSC 987) TaxID=367110 RepID=Q7RWK6_NEUCR|nr:protein-beta-aspartate methyltransferase [Neurospora crassa OR74A]EAA26831.3 protein-beta-aspartate methyltransferase [Neurospora crassa OR74A]KHE83868.1 PCMT-domain-containing protein [Neurospora crassa]|eukprot:XP_956067.3 protein-beta-aspartate methyltransferase [Neurospora crassa OR74A]
MTPVFLFRSVPLRSVPLKSIKTRPSPLLTTITTTAAAAVSAVAYHQSPNNSTCLNTLLLPNINNISNPSTSCAATILTLGPSSTTTLIGRSQSRNFSTTTTTNLWWSALKSNLNMAWYSSGGSNAELVENLWRNGLIKEERVKEAFLKVDRAHYAPTSPYSDSPQPIGHAATISAPHMHATAIEHLLPSLLPSPSRPAPRVLDIGSGSGYLTHVLAELVGSEGGTVVGLEHIPALRDLGARNMAKSAEGRDFLETGRVRFRVGDGRKGWRETTSDSAATDGASAATTGTTARRRRESSVDERSPMGEVEGQGERMGEDKDEGKWDAIHVGASAKEIHKELIDQLRSPGRMFVPVDDDEMGLGQHVWLVQKGEDGEVSKRRLFGVRYVPLGDPPRA